MVRFWDTSALVPLTVVEERTDAANACFDEDPGIVVWWGTRIECASALLRRQREQLLTAASSRDARRVVAALAKEWSEVAPTEVVRKRAERLLAVHSLRAADAMQLAAALIWARDDPNGHDFVCLDERLRAAAAQEGFQVLPAD